MTCYKHKRTVNKCHHHYFFTHWCHSVTNETDRQTDRQTDSSNWYVISINLGIMYERNVNQITQIKNHPHDVCQSRNL